MIEFIQANASWIVFGVLLVLMMKMHGAGGGMGCCGGGHQHGQQQDPEPDKARQSLPEPRQEAEPGKKDDEKELAVSGTHRHSGGCH